MRISTSWTFVVCSAALVLGACAMDEDEDTSQVEDLDPAGTLGDEELSDDGPLPEDAASDAPEVPFDVALVAPRFQMPFPCGQVWAGQTRTSHSPQNAVDFNR